ncbi:hypothetical protein AVEN_204081-1 [Araneus ventricosus]|uniref:Integrase catalytic domain-containing protein n=1 Tax=Araneus ventricosus TaxID=182803 RepID=A0A4Y2WA31_ARAVE|nr:hypothetical protein AVEN_56690-1 [Araneus ventricosus]GBO33319.1 hypothetical protein AVEN_79508-1 [Araneus ventricosus]GBO33326.1 hypothetical protein AVEN_136575-1 [Araneus ventricosus]GBO33331.1 hypothetical protein AVEN_204081-1 [Araneus ventricosus]
MGKSDTINTNKSSSLLVLSLHVNNAKISDIWNLDSLGIKEDSAKRTKTETQELALEHFRETWENEGIIEQINPDKVNPEGLGIHYLPHRAVFKDNSTTKVHPVFDGSAKTRNSVSINECIEKGPNLIEMIPAILNRFRWGKIGVISDIKQAFLQIALNESDRDVLRFMWWKDGDPQNTVSYRHCRVVFGISYSPFLLAAVLNHVLDQNILEQTQRILKTAKFDLRGWKNNFLPEIEEAVQGSSDAVEEKEVSVLGLTWDREEDTLSCELIRTEKEGEPITKRKILSVAHQLLDPIGFTCPITLIPKLLLQECWKLGISWDSKLPEDVIKKFKKWKDELHELKFLKIPRRLSNLDLNESSLTLHTFCDASKLAYATCIFLRAEKEGKVTCQLIQARSRIAPLKGISIPRMELLVCNIGARLANSVKKDLNLVDIESFFWSDSMDALYWIKKEGPWMTFVSNRVNEIRRLSEAYEWKFVPGTQNPADLPSRGCSVKTLLKKQWYEGPPWLGDSRDKWPDFELSPDENIIYAEEKKTVVSSLNRKNDEFYNNISSYKKIIRITGWMYRFYENTKGFNKKSGELPKEEIKRAELKILKKIQEDTFHNENTQHLKPLATFIDADGILRVKTKLTMREEDDNFKVPIVLPSDHHVVKSLILYKHQELGHPGVQFLMVALRENYWILKSRTIKKIIKTCIICQRFSVKQPEIPEGTLPEDRVKNASIFEVIGVDVAGPLIIKESKKVWILIITCVIYRAVHLELLMSLLTDNFILALRRFIARRGRPLIIYSDNGTNFIGMDNSLKTINLRRLGTSFTPITWKFIPPAAPWWGVFWERLIGDIVLLWNENLKRIHWPLGRILSIYASKDGIVRRPKIKTKSGIVVRPIRKLCPLELDGESLITNEDEVPDTRGDPERQEVPESNTVTTRFGRQA